MRSNFVFQEIWIGLRRNLTMTVVLVVVVAISLFLLGMGLLIMKQVNNTKTFWQGKVEISVYLCTSTSPSLDCRQNGPATAAERKQIMHDLASLPQVRRWDRGDRNWEAYNRDRDWHERDYYRDRDDRGRDDRGPKYKDKPGKGHGHGHGHGHDD